MRIMQGGDASAQSGDANKQRQENNLERMQQVEGKCLSLKPRFLGWSIDSSQPRVQNRAITRGVEAAAPPVCSVRRRTGRMHCARVHTGYSLQLEPRVQQVSLFTQRGDGVLSASRASSFCLRSDPTSL
jgi:hypothetical protein